MSRQSQRALVASLMMILASLAGCIGTDDLEETDALGTVMVSTYHVEQIVSAVGGDLVNVEMMSMSNIPVHDYEPSAQDLIRLQSSDVFFYHGLGLEPWVDETLDTMGADAPLSSATHAMPAGMETLDFETLLIDELCGYLNGPSTTDVHQLAEHAEDGEELHGDAGAYNLVMPEHEDEHDHEEGEHDDDHDEHDHEGDGHVEPEETLSTTDSACPAGTTVSVYHFEAGEYVFEFEAEDMETFTMAMAAMAGAHDHAHDHGDHDDHDEHGDEHGEEHHVCHDMTTHENHDEYTTEEECEAAGHSWMEDDHDGHDGHDDHDDHNDELTPEEAMSSFDTNNDSSLSWDEFWVAWNMDDDDDHDEHDHEDEHHDENESSDDDHDEHDHEDEHSPLEEALEGYMMEMLMTMFNESDADNSGGLSLEELEHFIEDIDAMEDDDLGMPGGDFIVGAFDEDGDSALSFEEFSEMMGMEHDHDDNGTHDENESAEEELMEAMMEMMFNMTDVNGDGYLNASEVEMMFEMMDDEDDHEEGLGFIHVHIEREGDYGIALPAGVELHVLSEGGHEGHDHDEHAHDEEDEHHDEEEGEHHDEEEGEHHDEDDHDDHGDDEALAYDPHSWLSPMAYAAQVDVVVGVMSTAFPDGAETFRANGDAFKAELNTLDDGFKAAFGESGTCTSNSVAANHNAYAYIADAYDIEFVTVHGLDPEGEPSAADIAEVVERIGEDEITVLFVEEYTDDSAVDSLVQQTVSDDLPNGVTVLTLYTMEMAPMDASDDYLSLMNKNLENLKTGLGC